MNEIFLGRSVGIFRKMIIFVVREMLPVMFY